MNMNKEEIYNKRIRPLMGSIIKICKKNKIAFAAQFMMDETGAYTSFYRKGPGSVHIAEVVDEMLFTRIDKYDQKITHRGVCFQGNWYLDEHLMMHIGEEVGLMYSNGHLDIISKNLPFEIITTLCL